MREIKELFALMPEYPGLNICLVDGFGVRDSFIEFCKERDAILYLKILDNKIDLKDDQVVKFERFDFDDKRYNLHSVLYDFVFLCVEPEKLELEEVLRKFYRALKNAGYIYLFPTNKNIEKTKELLEKTNYLSLNEIDNFNKRVVISAQKMHGWMRV